MEKKEYIKPQIEVSVIDLDNDLMLTTTSTVGTFGGGFGNADVSRDWKDLFN